MKYMLIILLTLTLVACEPEKPVEPAPQEDKNQVVDRAATVVVPYKRKNGRFAAPLPGGVVIEQPGFVRADALIKEPGRPPYRRVVVILRGLTGPEAVARIDGAIAGAGFVAQRNEEMHAGRYVETYSKAGEGDIQVEIVEFRESKNGIDSRAYRVSIAFPPKSASDASTD